MKVLLATAGVISIGMCVSGLALSFYSGMLSPKSKSDFIEMPLGNPCGIVVNEKGRIFIGSCFYSRIQVYEETGEFDKGWFVNAGGGDFRIRLSNDDLIEIAPLRRKCIWGYSAEGVLLRTECSNSTSFWQFKAANEQRADDNNGNSYLIRNRIVFPYIVRACKDGSQDVIVMSPITGILWGPFQIYLFGTTGLLIFIIPYIFRSRRART